MQNQQNNTSSMNNSTATSAPNEATFIKSIITLFNEQDSLNFTRLLYESLSGAFAMSKTARLAFANLYRHTGAEIDKLKVAITDKRITKKNKENISVLLSIRSTERLGVDSKLVFVNHSGVPVGLDQNLLYPLVQRAINICDTRSPIRQVRTIRRVFAPLLYKMRKSYKANPIIVEIIKNIERAFTVFLNDFALACNNMEYHNRTDMFVKRCESSILSKVNNMFNMQGGGAYIEDLADLLGYLLDSEDYKENADSFNGNIVFATHSLMKFIAGLDSDNSALNELKRA